MGSLHCFWGGAVPPEMSSGGIPFGWLPDLSNLSTDQSDEHQEEKEETKGGRRELGVSNWICPKQATSSVRKEEF